MRRGLGYQIGRVLAVMTVGFYVILIGFFLYAYLFNTGEIYRLDWNTVLSIVLADLPVGIVLWVILERRESKNRKLLDVVEVIRAKAEFSHLEVHYCDAWNTAEYPYLNYFIVNTKTKLAFWVSDEVQDLVEEEIIRKPVSYRDLEELNRHFATNGFLPQHRYPEGDELSRTT